jgi:hypothetical protein
LAARTPGSNGTNQATTLEAGLIADIRRAQSFERDSLRNPSSVNRITSSADDDSASFEARVNFPVTITTDSNGNVSIVPIDYFSVPSGGQPHYVAGSGGTVKSSTIQGAILEQTILLKNLELNPATNPTNGNYITWSISNSTVGGVGNGTFNASYNNMPLEITIASNGGQTTTGKAYLL